MRTKHHQNNKHLLLRIGLSLLLALMCFCLGVHYERTVISSRYSDYIIDRYVEEMKSEHLNKNTKVTNIAVKERYYLGSTEVNKSLFERLESSLVIDTKPSTVSNFEATQGVQAGTEVSYIAKNEAGKEYLYIITTYTDGWKSYNIISE
jgi:hypothetical protein